MIGRKVIAILLVSVVLLSILPAPASATDPKNPIKGKWSIEAKYSYEVGNKKVILTFSGEFNGGEANAGTLTGNYEYHEKGALVKPEFVAARCTPETVDVDVAGIPVEVQIGFSGPDNMNNWKPYFIDLKNNRGSQTFAISCPWGNVYSWTAETPPSSRFVNEINALIGPVKEGPGEGTHPQLPGRKLEYTFKRLSCDEIVVIPLTVILLNEPKKRDGSPVDGQYVKDMVKGMNRILKQACVQFGEPNIKSGGINADPSTQEGTDIIYDHTKTIVGEGAGISIINGIGRKTGGGFNLGDIHTTVMDTTANEMGRPEDVGEDTWAHEMKHALGFPEHSTDPQNIGAPTYQELADGSVMKFRTGTEITKSEKYNIIDKAKKYGKIRKEDPIKVNFIRVLKTDKTSDVFFYISSTPATGYNFTDMSELFIFSEEPFKDYNFKLSFEDALSSNQLSNIIIRLYFDTDGNSATGNNGYEKVAMLDITDIFPFKGSYELKLIDTSSNAQLFSGATNVTTVVKYRVTDFNRYKYIPTPLGYDLYFDIPSDALKALDLKPVETNILAQVDYPAAQVRDELKFSFLNRPEVSPEIEAVPYDAMPNSNLTITGIRFTPDSKVNISIGGTQLVSTATDVNGNFSIQVKVPELTEDWYTVTATDTNMQFDFTVISVNVATAAPVKTATPSITTTATPVPSQSADVTLYIESRSVVQDEGVLVPIMLESLKNIGNIDLLLKYDPSVLKATEVLKGSIVNSALFEANIQVPGEIRISFVNDNEASGRGSIAYIKFQAVGNAGSKSKVELTDVSANEADTMAKLSGEVIDGDVSIISSSEVLKGDVNGDGRITSIDALMALKMSVKAIPANAAADMDGDGQITSIDAAMILQAASSAGV